MLFFRVEWLCFEGPIKRKKRKSFMQDAQDVYAINGVTGKRVKLAAVTVAVYRWAERVV